MQDKFDEYLKNEEMPNRLRALTAKSFRNVDHELTGSDVNCELATYGDALLKHALCKILFDAEEENITVEKQRFESDKVLVNVIAKHYGLLDYMRFDRNDGNIPQDYNYPTQKEENQKGNDSPYKYIATAVEALVASFYLDNGEDFGLVIEIAKHWKLLIDNSKKEGFSPLCTT